MHVATFAALMGMLCWALSKCVSSIPFGLALLFLFKSPWWYLSAPFFGFTATFIYYEYFKRS